MSKDLLKVSKSLKILPFTINGSYGRFQKQPKFVTKVWKLSVLWMFAYMSSWCGFRN